MGELFAVLGDAEQGGGESADLINGQIGVVAG